MDYPAAAHATNGDQPIIFCPLPLPKPICSQFSSRGWCKYADSCSFAHCRKQGTEVATSIGDNGNNSMLYWLHRMPPDHTEYRLLVGTLEAHGFREARTDEERQRARLLWSGSSKAPAPIPKRCSVNRLGLGQGLGTWLTHKDRLISSLRRCGQSDLAPLSFALPQERAALIQYCQDQDITHPRWIVKLARSGRGRGTFMTTNAASIGEASECVVCQYVERPLLVAGYKHDLRLYVIVLQSSPLRAYIHTGGYARFAAKSFTLSDLSDDQWDPFVHLTYLDSVNRLQHQIQREKEWTVQQLFQWMIEQPCYGKERTDNLWLAIKQLACRAISCLPAPAQLSARHSTAGAAPTVFELFGFDVLVDVDLRPWLLEVNGQPHLGSTSKNGAHVYASEHAAKAAAIAGTLTLGLADNGAGDLDEVARGAGFERLLIDSTIGTAWWKSPLAERSLSGGEEWESTCAR